VKRPLTCLTLLGCLSLAFLTTACGGGGGGISSNPAPTPTSGPYSASSLNGTYAFEMSGQDSGGFFARIGSFTANGAGQITGGVQDVNTATSGVLVLPFSSSAYTIGSNGKGTLGLTDQTGTLQFSIVMTSMTGGLITQADGNATASGNFTLQTPAAFVTTSIKGNYAFDFSGNDANGTPESIVGQLTSTGNGAGSGLLDANDGGTLSHASTFTAASFTMDTTNGPTFGRGVASIAGLNFAFYIVDATRIKFLETDFPAITLGDAVVQTGTIPTTTAALSGSFAFVLAGSSISGNDVRAGRLTLSGGTIGINTLQMDDDDSSGSGSGNSNHTPIPAGAISAATYAIDTANPGTGRGTLTFTDSSAGTFSFIFYLISPTRGFIQDNSAGIVADGSMQAQTGNPYTSAAEAGNWAFNWSGTSINGTTGGFGEEDFLGQYTLSSSGSASGAVDFTEISAGSVVTNAAISGMLTINSDGTGRNGYSITLATSPSTTLNFAAYFIDPNTMLVVGTDTHRVIAGTVVRNF